MALYYADINDKQILADLTEAKIKYLQLRNHFNKNGRQNLSESDLRYIVDNYGKIPTEEIAKKVKKKPHTIIQLSSYLGLNYVHLAEYELILNQLLLHLVGGNYDTYNFNLMVKAGFPYRRHRKFIIVHLQSFFDWYKKHIKLICCHAYKEGSLPIEPDWFLEKIRADKRAYEYMYKRQWTAEEDNRLRQLVFERKGYKEISRTLKRTGLAIKRRCYDLGIQKPKRFPSKLWTAAELNKCRELWLKGYEPCIIAEEIDKSDRQVVSLLERNQYFGQPPQKFMV